MFNVKLLSRYTHIVIEVGFIIAPNYEAACDAALDMMKCPEAWEVA